MITEDYVSFETAKLLKEKGFDEECSCFYNNIDYGTPGLEVDGRLYYKNSALDDEEYAAPTLQMVMKWLREAHNIFIGISVCERYENQMDVETKVMFFFELLSLKDKQIIDRYSQEYVHTYEEACEAAIKYCLRKLV